MDGSIDMVLGDMDDLTAVLRSIRDGMADINSDFEAMLSRWDGTDNEPADPEQADWEDIYIT